MFLNRRGTPRGINCQHAEVDDYLLHTYLDLERGTRANDWKLTTRSKHLQNGCTETVATAAREAGAAGAAVPLAGVRQVYGEPRV